MEYDDSLSLGINHPLYPKGTEIDSEFCKGSFLFPLQSLLTLIDIFRIVSIKIYMDIFIKQLHNFSSLIIQNGFHDISFRSNYGLRLIQFV